MSCAKAFAQPSRAILTRTKLPKSFAFISYGRKFSHYEAAARCLRRRSGKGCGQGGFTRRKSSHIRLTTEVNGQHHVTIPDHDAVKIGTLADIVKDVADHLGMKYDELLGKMFKKKR